MVGMLPTSQRVDKRSIGNGWFEDVAQWLYIVYGHNNPWQTRITPLQCLLKAYDHMPHITELPDFIAAIKEV
jgi:hypothetical protein